MSEAIIQIAIVDDDRLVVQLLSDYFQKNDALNVSIEAYSGNSFLSKLKESEECPQVVILDLRMDDGDGIQTLEYLNRNYPDIKIVVLSSYYKASFMGYMLKAGVHAFIPKGTDKEDLLAIIFEVHKKGHFFTNEQITHLRKQLPNKKPPITGSNSGGSLSERELEILKLLCQQLTAKEIAKKLFISTKTVEAHKSNLLLKTGVKNMVGLIIFAIKNSIVNPDEIFLLD